jgi:hypothetical protein
MSFIEPIGTVNVNPHRIHLVQNNPQRSDSMLQYRCVGTIKGVTFGLEQAACPVCFPDTIILEIHIRPARKCIFEIPDAIPVTQQNYLYFSRHNIHTP